MVHQRAPGLNVSGAALPGLPCVITGHNEQIAWGVTNAQRDVKDYYEIKFKDESRKEYMYNGEWKETELRIDTIKVKGASPIYDTIAFTVFGPVIYDRTFSKELSNNKAIALRWTGHDQSNEAMTFYKLNRAKNYDDYLDAIKTYTCPGQNFAFASKQGDIAIWQQGKFPARWYGQGMYVMPGIDSSYQWQGFIPQNENPHAHMDSGFLESANQRPVDSTYPYYTGNDFPVYRGYTINHKLDAMNNITIDDMKALQTDNYNAKAEFAKDIYCRVLKVYYPSSTREPQTPVLLPVDYFYALSYHRGLHRCHLPNALLYFGERKLPQFLYHQFQ